MSHTVRIRKAPERHMFKIYPWENMLAHDATIKHLCGQACLQKIIDRWLNDRWLKAEWEYRIRSPQIPANRFIYARIRFSKS
jgi:hypothetical protein